MGTPATTRGSASWPALKFEARGKGEWSRNLRVHIGAATHFADTAFSVTIDWVEAGASRTLEVFDDLSMDPEAEGYFADIINDQSEYVTVVDAFAEAVDAFKQRSRRYGGLDAGAA